MNDQAFLVTVRNKKRVGYTYELTLKVKGNNFLHSRIVSIPISICLICIVMKSGEWVIEEEKKMIKGQIDIPEFSFGELDDLQVYDNHVQFYEKVNWEDMIDNRDLMFLFNMVLL